MPAGEDVGDALILLNAGDLDFGDESAVAIDEQGAKLCHPLGSPEVKDDEVPFGIGYENFALKLCGQSNVGLGFFVVLKLVFEFFLLLIQQAVFQIGSCERVCEAFIFFSESDDLFDGVASAFEAGEFLGGAFEFFAGFFESVFGGGELGSGFFEVLFGVVQFGGGGFESGFGLLEFGGGFVEIFVELVTIVLGGISALSLFFQVGLKGNNLFLDLGKIETTDSQARQNGNY